MMPLMGSFTSKSPIAKVMAFIDGGYLRSQYKRKYGTEEIDFNKLKIHLMDNFNANCGGKYDGDLVRVYYYDAIVDHDHPNYSEQRQYFLKIGTINGYQVRLGRLISTGKNDDGPLKQKGVDVHLAVDMITKAYQDQYDFAILLAGDDDFLDVINGVKDSGKRVFGLYFREHISDNLYDALDARIEVDNFGNNLKIIKV
jgi:uncharacterized LabA/DUF88 family protein